eukprot:Skav228255  [mRNA]  locus=scaffold1171:24529:25719:+ [translate_table: standard]
MSTAIDSEADFRARGAQIGVTTAVLDLLKAGGVSSYGSFAFITPYQPGQPDETPLITALSRVMGRAPTNQEQIGLRRLFFESVTLAINDLKQRQDRDDAAEPTRLPVAERNARLADQKTRLAGVHFSSETEPSHKLVDTVNQMGVDQTLEWIPWEKLTNRASEITHTTKDFKLSFDSHGGIKVAQKHSSPDMVLTGELMVRQALNRRARAFDLAQLCSYNMMETWHERIFELLHRESTSNAHQVTMAQLKEADQMLFRKLAEKTQGNLTQAADGTRPMQTHFNDCMNHPEVQFCLIPRVKAAKSEPQQASSQHANQKNKSKGKGNGKVRNDTKDKPAALPPGCNQMTPQNKPICNTYNRGKCAFAKDGKRCKFGFHVCWKCFKPKPYYLCCGCTTS